MPSERPVVVMQLPPRLTLGRIQAFRRDLEPLISADRPRIVFDFSGVHQIDSAGVDLLLRCVEEVTSRDGDLKLAAVPPESAVILEMTRVDRLFEIFPTTAEAVRSFQDSAMPELLPLPYLWPAKQGSSEADVSGLKRAG